MRWLLMPILISLVFGACATARPPREPPRTVAVDAKLLPPPLVVPGEQMEWSVWWQGAQIGNASLETTASGSRAQFASSGLARLVGNVRFEQATSGRSTTEDAVTNGGRERRVVALDSVSVPGRAPLQTLASALGAVRAWARPGATHAYAWVIVDGALYRLDVAAPQTDSDGLRVDATVRPLDPAGMSVALSLWLDDARTPIRFAVLANGERITAQLSATTARSVAKTGR